MPDLQAVEVIKTYSLISFSLSKGLLGFLDVFLSAGRGETRVSRSCQGEEGDGGLSSPISLLTVRVLFRHVWIGGLSVNAK